MSMKEQSDKNCDEYIIKEITNKRGLVVLKINDEDISLTPSSYSNHFLYPNKKTTKKELIQLKDEEKLTKAKKYLSNILNNNRYTVFEVKNKLKLKFALDDNKIQILISDYIQSGVLDDLSFAIDYIENGQSKFYSFNYLCYKIKQKGISDDILKKDEVLELQQNDSVSLSEFVEKLNDKYSKIPLKARKEKITKNCLQHGYSYEDIKYTTDDFFSSNSFDYESDYENEKISLNKKIIACYNSLKDKGYSNYELKNKIISKMVYKGFKYSDIINEIEKEKLIND